MFIEAIFFVGLNVTEALTVFFFKSHLIKKVRRLIKVLKNVAKNEKKIVLKGILVGINSNVSFNVIMFLSLNTQYYFPIKSLMFLPEIFSTQHVWQLSFIKAMFIHVFLFTCSIWTYVEFWLILCMFYLNKVPKFDLHSVHSVTRPCIFSHPPFSDQHCIHIFTPSLCDNFYGALVITKIFVDIFCHSLLSFVNSCR